MKKVQVLVTTMHEKDFSKFHSMNIRSDALLANQADSFCYAKETINNYNVQSVSPAGCPQRIPIFPEEKV